MNIDDIMDMLDWHNSPEMQEHGRTLACEIKCINVFLQPCHPKYNKNVWDNCAKILAVRSDLELHPFLNRLFEWLIDLNWPGAICIQERLSQYSDTEWFDYVLGNSIRRAKALGEDIWLNNLYETKQLNQIYRQKR